MLGIQQQRPARATAPPPTGSRRCRSPACRPRRLRSRRAARHTCALLIDGTVWCWGKGGNGELGNGSTSDSSVPVEVTGLPPAAQIAIGGTQISGNSSCALTVAGGVFCWGWNASGQLGNGTTTDSDVPVAVIGSAAACRRSPTTAARRAPSPPPRRPAAGVTTPSGSSATGPSAVTSRPRSRSADSPRSAAPSTPRTPARSAGSIIGGTAVCWGWNGDGQLGNGSTTNTGMPTPVLGL